MRAYYTCLFFVFFITGCANYAGIHPKAYFYDTESLDIPLQYSLPPKTLHAMQKNWWDRFHDSQLNQLITIALADSPTIQMAASRLSRMEQLSDAAAATHWPSVNLKGAVVRERFAEFGIVPPPFNGRTFNIGDIGFTFKYELDFWGKNRQTLAARISETCALLADLAEARLVLSTAVASTYFELQGTIAQRRIANRLYQQRRALLKISQRRAKRGIVSAIPVETALTAVQKVKLEVDRYKQAEKLLRHQLAVLIGKNPMATRIEVRQFSYRHIALPACISANLLVQRPDVAAARLRAEAAAHLIQVAKAQFFPDINLIGLFSYQSVFINRLFEPGNQNNLFGAAIDLPIFDAGARRANLGVKDDEYDIAVNEYNQTILNALQEVADQVSTINTLQSQLRAQNQSLLAIDHTYKLTDSRYNHGIVDYSKVLEVRILLLQQQGAQITYQTRQLQADVAMIKALGGDYLIKKG